MEVGVEELKAGDIVVVRPGEKIPVDGVVVKGLSSVNQAPITGESIPVEKGSGDEVFAAGISKKLGITEYRANLLPEDKITIVKRLQDEGHKVCMIGDGVNDTPALAQSDVGIAMGVAGTDVAFEAAHIALMRDDWSQISKALGIGRKTYKIIRQGIALGITWDIVTMGLASVGILTPVMAAAVEELPTLAVAANASRLLVKQKPYKSANAFM